MERMKEIEIFGIPALFTEKRIDHDTVYPGMYRYELETVNDGVRHSIRHLSRHGAHAYPDPNGQRPA